MAKNTTKTIKDKNEETTMETDKQEKWYFNHTINRYEKLEIGGTLPTYPKIWPTNAFYFNHETMEWEPIPKEGPPILNFDPTPPSTSWPITRIPTLEDKYNNKTGKSAETNIKTKQDEKTIKNENEITKEEKEAGKTNQTITKSTTVYLQSKRTTKPMKKHQENHLKKEQTINNRKEKKNENQNQTIWEPVKREIFKPINKIETTNPLFTSTKEPSMVEIQKGNFTIQLETNYKNPYIKTTIEVPTEVYEEFITIIDIKDISTDNYNALRFLAKQMENTELNNQLGFKSMTEEPDLFKHVPKQFKGQEPKKWEYAKFPKKIGYADCNIACPLMGAQLPETTKQLKEAGKLFNMSTEYMWIETEQKSQERQNWSWKHKYNYQIIFNEKEIYPQPETEYTPLTGEIIPQNCKAYKNGKQIQHQNIGMKYEYWSNGIYHKTTPYRLHTVISPNLNCKIIVTNDEMTQENTLDNEICICVKEKNSRISDKISAEMRHLHLYISNQINDTAIEEWRFKTSQPLTILENLDGQITPKNTIIDQRKIREIKKRYITRKDLTNIKLGSTRSKTIKYKEIAKRLGKNLMKTIISKPETLMNFHKAITEHVGRGTEELQVTYLDTKNIQNDAKSFSKAMNELSPSFEIKQEMNKITIKAKNNDYREWEQLDEENSDTIAIDGLMKSRRISSNYDAVKGLVTRKIIENIKIPRNNFKNKQIAKNKPTIATLKKHNSYFEIRIYVPVILQEITRVIKTYPLPHDYHKEIGKFIIKDVPRTILITPGKEKPETNKCGMDILQNKGTLTNCQNTVTTLEDINRIAELGEFIIYITRKLGKTSINCPKQRLKFTNIKEELNILITHKSCYLNSQESNQHIDPTSTKETTENGFITLMSYTINTKQNWIPDIKYRWIIQIVIITIITVVAAVIIVGTIRMYKIKKENMKKEIKQEASMKTRGLIKRICNYNKKKTVTEQEEYPTYYPFHLNEQLGKEEEINTKQEIVKIELPMEENLQRNYQQDLEDHMGDDPQKAEQVEDFYATIRPWKKNKNKNQGQEESMNGNPFNLGTQSNFLKAVTQRLQEEPNTIVEIDKEQGNKTKWKPLYQQ